MFSDTAAGSVARVHWLADTAPAELVATAEALFAEQRPDHVQVFVAGNNGRYVAESYTPDGTRILFCGHGALCAAYAVFQEYETDATRLDFSNADHNWQARRSAPGSSDINFIYSLIYKHPELNACAVPDFAAEVLGVQPQAAAVVGGDAGYLIVELDDVAAVRAVQPDFAALVAAPQRALIVTAKDTTNAAVFRYFAPQYGNPEDAATGSAAVQLAAYWLSPSQSEQWTLRQLSPQGAEMQVACRNGAVDLAARVGYR
jgi:predicted PhzF superfamily epimerase YddE/YHI9